ncbi:RagB/SusD family nutrient uptake outer membrane protein [Thalassobellus suaedae]|uniref:RagB/SusD family nutrient uptake outer membrane protein n=1 Tax=Thalassobellus suaedae TaxID=3074124 RepID=A0ABY9XU96_9FLAO|nr:RagB/SusD family nutrient uptake outer membrane protein [Flavobacteriaceae bacterium HL-DH14]
MKHIKYICLSLLFIAFSSCNEDKILEETPLDFTTVDNSYKTQGNFEAAVAQLYNQARRYFGDAEGSATDMDVWFGTDAGWHAREFQSHVYSQYAGFGPDNSDVAQRWTDAYKMVSNANTVISRIADVDFDNETAKNRLLTEARFFRAWAYRALVYLYGDVPLILEEVPSARRDFVRAPKADVLAAIIDDLEFAKTNLPSLGDEAADGRLTKDVARHFLAELYIVTGDNQKAVNNASEVIDSGNYALMENRFGTRASEQGDVYWDLFRLGNQNRSTGNTEGIWLYQVEYETLGGYGRASGDANFWERLIGPEYNRFTAKDENLGVRTFVYESTYHGGRGQAFFRPSTHVTHGIWNNVDPADYENDIRNSDNNVLRKWWIDNPLSSHYGDIIDLRTDSKLAYETYLNAATIENDSNRYVYPVFLKLVQINNHFDTDLTDGSLSDAQEAKATQAHKDLIASYGGIGPKMNGNARRYFADHYAARLPETLLLRAEAYMNLGGANNLDLAAADINVIRKRANASLITGSDVTIDFILDERLRELFLEEPRRLTLNRLGLLYERTKKYNHYSSASVAPHNNLYPIPSVEIQNNTEAELTQNDGYEN